MTFHEILKRLVEETPGALAGAVMGSDGIPVEEYARRRSPGERPTPRFELPAVAVEFQSVVEQARKVAASIEGKGGLEEIVLVTGELQLLFRQVDEEYFVVLALGATGTLGKARYLIAALLREVREAL